MSGKRPRIAVTGPDRGGTAAWLFTRFAVWRAGGRALRFTPQRRRSLDGIQGVIIGGGSDVSPELYQSGEMLDTAQELAEESVNLAEGSRRWSDRVLFPLVYLLRLLLSTKEGSRLDPARDELEQSALDHALENGLPVLGICRGSQLLNVHFGGTLHQNLDEFYEETPNVRNVFPKKIVYIEEDSRLARTLGTTRTRVNALHSQAVDETGRRIEAVAREPTTVIQGIEYQDHPFVVGVQWHPEYLPQVRSQVRLFERLVRQAAAR